LSTDNSEKKLIDMQQAVSLNVDDLLYKCITEKLKQLAVSQTDANIMIFNVLDQLALMKLSSELRTNH